VHHGRAGRRADDAADLVADGERHLPPALGPRADAALLHVRAYSATRASAAAGIAPSEWLIKYVVCSRIGNRSRYDVRSVEAALGRSDIAGRRTEESPVRFCSRMCADQPATREHANIAGASGGGISATSRTSASSTPRSSQRALGMSALELRESGLFEPLGDLDLLESRARAPSA
jgi:hypothetical protein